MNRATTMFLERAPALLFAASLVALGAPRLVAQQDVTPDGVLVVVSDASSISQLIGDYYATARAIPSDHVFHLPKKTPVTEEITRAQYNFWIRDKLVDFFTNVRPDLKDVIKYVVLTKGIPHKVYDPNGSGTMQQSASVDSELTQLFTGNVGDGGQSGRVANPFFASYHSPANWSSSNCSYLVFRLDGYQTNPDPVTGIPADVQRLIDDSQTPATTGTVLLDATAPTGQGNDWIVSANDILTKMAIPVVLDTTATMQSGYVDLIGYCSWGSNDPANAGVPYYGEIPPGSGIIWPGTFTKGSLTTDYVSTSARTYLDGSQNYGQSLAVDLEHGEAGGTNGHVYEPYLDACSRPNYLFPHYFQGLQAGLAYYHSIAYMSWMNVVVVDPLMKSALVAPKPPEFSDITPTRIASGSSGVAMSFHGDWYTAEEDMTVTLGGVPCSNLYVPNPNGCGCTTGTLPPGLLDLQVTTFMGTGTMRKALVSYPAMDLTGTVAVGGNVTITLYGDVNDQLLMFTSLGTASLPLPPFGVLGLDPANHFSLLLVSALPAQRLDLNGSIPNDPALSGFTFYTQSLIGPDLATKNMKFTNVVTVAIQ
jgi:uncharacterized protein (TIGR03790 family)